MKPNLRVIDNEQPHARDIARQRIAEFRSNAQREGLPTTNLHDDKGAELLDRDGVVRRSYPGYAMSEARQSWWSKLFQRR